MTSIRIIVMVASLKIFIRQESLDFSLDDFKALENGICGV